MDTDNQIIKRIRDGEEQLFATLVDRYAERVMGLVSRFVDDAMEAEDIAQDTFVQAYSSLGSFRGDASFASWLYRIAYNNAVMYLRKHRLRFVSIEDEASYPFTEQEVNDFFQAEDDSRIHILLEALDVLPPLDRVIIDLYYYDELSIKDIAQTVGMSETSVSTRLYRIRKHLYAQIRRKEQNYNLGRQRK